VPYMLLPFSASTRSRGMLPISGGSVLSPWPPSSPTTQICYHFAYQLYCSGVIQQEAYPVIPARVDIESKLANGDSHLASSAVFGFQLGFHRFNLHAPTL
jgi:hypothetical protein